MGATPDQLDTIADLHRRGLLPFPGAIADLGAQEVHSGTQADIDRFAAAFGRTAPQMPPTGRGCFIGQLFAEMGFRYESLDIVPAPFVRHFDLNFDSVPADMKGAFDLVMNFGTTEHVMNQLNAFKTMHDLCKVGGLIYGIIMRNGNDDHGLLKYTVHFLPYLVVANNYQMVYYNDHDQRLKTKWFDRFRLDLKRKYWRDHVIWAAWQKTSDAPFKVIVDA